MIGTDCKFKNNNKTHCAFCRAFGSAVCRGTSAPVQREDGNNHGWDLIIPTETKTETITYNDMKYLFKKWHAMFILALSGCMFASCDMMEQDNDDCPYGLYLTFKYDYNLQRADMFNDHVGSVTLYVFDEDGKLVKTQEESNIGGVAPLRDKGYAMHVTDLAPGSYKFIALAGQKPYEDMLQAGRAKFVRADMPLGSDMTNLNVRLERAQVGADMYDIVNNRQPLDTLWHGIEVKGFEVSATHATYGEISLVRDTKHINVSLRELDDPTTMSINNYDIRITDRNSHILYDNSLDETATVVYTPYVTWDTEDSAPAIGADGEQLAGVGKIGHADIMTSRILSHDNVADDGVLAITNKLTGVQVAMLNLPDLLCQLRSFADRSYSKQEFLDRGYDYQVALFLRGDKLEYINISISILGWSKRIQLEEL